MHEPHWKPIYTALYHGEAHLPPWAGTQTVSRALKELLDDLDCGMLRLDWAFKRLGIWREAAKRFGCLELYEQIEALTLERATLAELLAHRGWIDRTISAGIGDLARYRDERRSFDRLVARKCAAQGGKLYDNTYWQAVRESAQALPQS